jgi:hypothetical protein
MLLIVVLCGAGIGSILPAKEFRIAAETVAEDIRISPAADPDPRDGTAIIVSPIDERIIVGASKVILGAGSGTGSTSRIAYYHSSDEGKTWETKLLGLETPQKLWGRASEPVLAVDLNGIFYLSVLMLDNGTFDTGIYIFKSTDGGQTFANPVAVFVDIGNTSPRRAGKPHIVVDTSSSSTLKNSIYAVWSVTEINAMGVNQTTIETAYLRPGSSAFSSPKTISHRGDMRGPSAAMGPNGEFYAAWEGIGNPRVILFNASTDGGDTFLPFDVAPSIDLKIHDFVGSLSQPTPALTVVGVTRMNCFPSIEVDRSSGPNRGMIYISWAETSNRVEADIFIKRLTPPNGGRPDITLPHKITSTALTGDQFFPRLSVDSSDGRVDVAFYSRNDTNGMLISAFLARSSDGGTSFEEHQISSAAFDPRIQANIIPGSSSPIGIGDYIGLYSQKGESHLLWADTRNGKQEIFYGGILSPSGGGGGGTGDDPPANDECQNAQQINALPFTDDIITDTATASPDDPATCASGQNTHSVWYRFTAGVNSVYGVDTLLSDYDTVLSVYTGNCGALTRIACNDNSGNATAAANRSLLTFAATAGQTYLIEVSSKGNGGRLILRFGHPTITKVEFAKAPDKSKGFKITGAGFIEGDAKVIYQELNQSEIELPLTFYSGTHNTDGTVTIVFGTEKKLKKKVKAGRTFIVTVRTPATAGNRSNSFSFTK